MRGPKQSRPACGFDSQTERSAEERIINTIKPSLVQWGNGETLVIKHLGRGDDLNRDVMGVKPTLRTTEYHGKSGFDSHRWDYVVGPDVKMESK